MKANDTSGKCWWNRWDKGILLSKTSNKYQVSGGSIIKDHITLIKKKLLIIKFNHQITNKAIL